MQKLDARVPPQVVNEVREFVLDIPYNELDWPIHRWDPNIMKLLSYIPVQRGQVCDPQIVVQPKGGEPYFFEFHADQEPDWANGRKYTSIVCVCITEQNYQNGGVCFKDSNGVLCPSFSEGTIFSFEPHELHSPGVNQRDEPRVSIYFRWLDFPAPVFDLMDFYKHTLTQKPTQSTK